MFLHATLISTPRRRSWRTSRLVFGTKTSRRATTAPHPVSIFTSRAFPCQPFSAAGKQQGFQDDQGRGTIFWSVREYIEAKRPKVFILENVSQLKTMQGGRYYQAITKSLVDLGGYTIFDQVINTKDHGVPQNRKRIYFVGIQQSVYKGGFEFPEALPAVSIENFLDPKPTSPKVDATTLPPKTATTANRNVKLAIRRLIRAGKKPFSQPYIADIDSTTSRMKFMLDLTPCITCARCGNRGHWITNRGRRLNIVEMMRLQGMHTPGDGFKIVVCNTEMGRQVGNGMSVNVMERLLARILPAAGLVRAGSLRDRWAAAAAQNRMPRPVPLAAPKKVKTEEPAAVAAVASKRKAGSWTTRTCAAPATKRGKA